MPRLVESACRRRLETADHAVLASVDEDRVPHAVPVCFVVADELVVVPVDDVKAKSGRPLKRVENVVSTGRAALLVERWDADDWSRLWWVRADCVSDRVSDPGWAERALADKYRQYEDARFAGMLTLRIERMVGWSATI